VWTFLAEWIWGFGLMIN